MGKAKNLVNKLKRLHDEYKQSRGFRTQDKVDLKDEVLADSPKAFKYIRSIQRRLDSDFGQQLLPNPDKLAKELTFTGDVTEVDFSAAVKASFDNTVDVEGAPAAVIITADVAGAASNDSITGDGSSDVDTLVAALPESYTVSVGGTVVPANGEVMDIDGGLDAVAAEATLDLTADITLTSVAAGASRNSETLTLQVLAAAANPGDTVLVDFTGTTAAIVCTVTPNDGTNNGAVPVDLTTAELTELINNGTVAGKNVTLTDGSSLRALQTASGGDGTALADGGEGDGEVATFASGADAVAAEYDDSVPIQDTATITGEADVAGAAGNQSFVGNGSDDIDTLAGAGYTFSAGGTEVPVLGEVVEFTGGADEIAAKLELQLGSGIAREAGVVVNDYVQILAGTLQGRVYKIIAVNYSSDLLTLQYEDSALSGTESNKAVKLKMSGSHS